MTEQDGAQPSTKQRRNRQASKQNATQKTTLQRPSNEDKAAWREYWVKQGQPWRTEPEIDEKRQAYLEERRAIIPDIEQGIYPFKDIILSRSDVEWLLATHENRGMRGPVDWNDESQRQREGVDLRGADLRQANLSGLPLSRMRGGLTIEERFETTEKQRSMAAAYLQKANLGRAQLQGATLAKVQLQKAIIERAQLQGAYLWSAQLQGAYLYRAQLQSVDLGRAQLQGADLRRTDLEYATLDRVIFSDQTYGSARFADISWGEVNLAVVDWGQMTTLGDEEVVHQIKDRHGKTKDKHRKVDEYREAVRAYRQLSVVLRNQGLNEDAARFAYRAQMLQRTAFRLQGGIRSFGQYLSSLLLDLLAGYGYKPWRSFLAYLIVITAFATTYFFIGRTVGPVLSPLGSVVFSMTSFHGRGFFPGGIRLDDPLTVLAALEAFVGLLIEVTFIATLTQRLFGK